MKTQIWSLVYGFVQAKFSALVESPEPLYLATAGYGHSGRVITAFGTPSAPGAYLVAATSSTGVPFTTQFSSESKSPYFGPFAVSSPNCPNELAPGPPAQCSIPGTM